MDSRGCSEAVSGCTHEFRRCWLSFFFRGAELLIEVRPEVTGLLAASEAGWMFLILSNISYG